MVLSPLIRGLFDADRSSTHAKHRRVVAIVIMAVTFGVAAAIAVHSGSVLRYGDEQAYRQSAIDLLRLHRYTADGIHPSAYRPPGFAWFLVIPEAFGSSVTGMRIFNALALVLAQFFLFQLVRSVARETTALIALCLTLIYPVLLYSATLLFPQTLGAALLLCGMWLLLDSGRITLTRGIFAGLVWGFLILTIPTFLVVGMATLSVVLWRRRQSRSSLVAAAVVACVVLGAWSARNYRVFHAFVLVSTNGGVNLLLGNSENATSNSSSSTLAAQYVSEGHRQGDEVAADHYYSREAKQWILSNPTRALRLYCSKLVHYFGFVDNLATDDDSSQLVSQTGRMVIMMITWGPLMLLFFLRLVYCRRFPLSTAETLFAGLYLLNAAFVSVFFARIRFRIPMDWLLLVVDAGTIQMVMDRLLSREAKSASKQKSAECQSAV
jgi:4-amino-4-deoxy-L-arabinose transferase-like glycosyltransferase